MIDNLAGKTLGLFVLATLLWLAGIVLYFFGILGFGWCLVLCTIAGYFNFTPMHEAAHGNVGGTPRGRSLLDGFVGHIAAATLLAPFPVFRALHLQHHAMTNHPGQDPDYWVATRHPLVLVVRCLTIIPHYYYHALIKPRLPVKKTQVSIPLLLGLYGAIVVVFHFVTGRGLELVLLWGGSTVLAFAVLALLFDWLPHTPHQKIGRYVDTHIYDYSWLTLPLLYQNYHLVHHLNPRYPFYDYAKVYRRMEREVREHGARIYERGPSKHVG